MVGSWTISSLKFTPIKPVKKESRITTIKKQNKMLYSFAVAFPLLVTLILIFSSFSS